MGAEASACSTTRLVSIWKLSLVPQPPAASRALVMVEELGSTGSQETSLVHALGAVKTPAPYEPQPPASPAPDDDAPEELPEEEPAPEDDEDALPDEPPLPLLAPPSPVPCPELVVPWLPDPHAAASATHPRTHAARSPMTSTVPLRPQRVDVGRVNTASAKEPSRTAGEARHWPAPWPGPQVRSGRHTWPAAHSGLHTGSQAPSSHLNPGEHGGSQEFGSGSATAVPSSALLPTS